MPLLMVGVVVSMVAGITRPSSPDSILYMILLDAVVTGCIGISTYVLPNVLAGGICSIVWSVDPRIRNTSQIFYMSKWMKNCVARVA